MSSSQDPSRKRYARNQIFGGIFMLLMGSLFMASGFYTITIHATKTTADQADFDITHDHLFGLLTSQDHVERVSDVEVVWRDSASGHRRSTSSISESDVILNSANGKVGVMGYGSENSLQKDSMAAEIKDYLYEPTESTLDATYNMNNIFGGLGIGMILLSLWLFRDGMRKSKVAK